MHTPRLRAAALAVLAIVAPPPLHAQSALVLFGHVGRAWPTTALADSGDDLTSAFALGAGAGLQVNGHVAVRASLTRSEPEYRGATVALTQPRVVRTYVGGDLQIGWPADSPLVPYVLFGGGVVRSAPEDASQQGSSDIAGRIGVGINRLGSFGVFFIEAVGMAYKFSGLGFDRLQIDLTVQAGWAVALPF